MEGTRTECSRWLFLSDPKINTSVSIEIKTYFEAQFPCLSKFLKRQEYEILSFLITKTEWHYYQNVR